MGEYFQPADASIWLRELAVAGSPFRRRSTPPSRRTCWSEFMAGATIIYQQLQMAYYMGITEVILIGLDFFLPTAGAEGHHRGSWMKRPSNQPGR